MRTQVVRCEVDLLHCADTLSSSNATTLAGIADSSANPPEADHATVLLDGELYNWRELSRELGLTRHENSTAGQLEVINELVRRHGATGLSRLKGMFAVAVATSTSVLLGRDRLGIKPLFYATLGSGETVFGSELKTLLAHPSVPVDLDADTLDEIAVFGHINSLDRTPFRAIRQVPPGCTLDIRPNRSILSRYWRLPPAFETGQCDAKALAESAQLLGKALRESLAAMMDYDSTMKGFCLSGGIDSSLLLALSLEVDDSPPTTFTLADSRDSEDSIAARLVARAAGAQHHEFHVSLRDLLAELPLFIRQNECPVGSGAFDQYGGVACQMLSRRVSEYVSVAFTGDGADVLLGGCYWPHTHPLGFADGLRERAEKLDPLSIVRAQVEAAFPEPDDEDEYRLSVFDLLMQGRLANHLLWSTDRSSSAYGLQMRPAYLFEDAAEAALKLPVGLKANRTETKRALRAAAAPLFLALGIESCLVRPKLGLPAAVANIAVEFEDFATRLVPADHVGNHPWPRHVHSPVDAVMFDLFQLVVVQNRGVVPDGFAVHELYESGAYADLYR